MNRLRFLSLPQVTDFVSWAGKFKCDESGHLQPMVAGSLSTLVVALDIPKSAKVRERVHGRVPFHQLTRWYSWRANGMTTGDFAETRATVARLIQGMTRARTRDAAIAASKEILKWGGDRNSSVGALPFLLGHADLVGYLDAVKGALSLQNANISYEGLASVSGMNSMLTKVHAFNSGDGLPIYDSRVAGAVATLVETWRRARGGEGQPLLPALSFPEVGGGGARRSVRARYPDCVPPPVLRYASGDHAEARAHGNAIDWASAKVRLGWLLSALLEKPSPDGIRSLEACLFMAGYDCASINR